MGLVSVLSLVSGSVCIDSNHPTQPVGIFPVSSRRSSKAQCRTGTQNQKGILVLFCSSFVLFSLAQLIPVRIHILPLSNPDNPNQFGPFFSSFPRKKKKEPHLLRDVAHRTPCIKGKMGAGVGVVVWTWTWQPVAGMYVPPAKTGSGVGCCKTFDDGLPRSESIRSLHTIVLPFVCTAGQIVKQPFGTSDPGAPLRVV